MDDLEDKSIHIISYDPSLFEMDAQKKINMNAKNPRRVRRKVKAIKEIKKVEFESYQQLEYNEEEKKEEIERNTKDAINPEDLPGILVAITDLNEQGLDNFEKKSVTYEDNYRDCEIIQDPNSTAEAVSAAQTRLLQRNFALVYACIGQYTSYFCHMYEADDAKSSACQGILRAAKSYNRGRSSFSTYAYVWMSHYIQRDIATFVPQVRFPVRDIQLYYRCKRKYGDTDYDSFYQKVYEDPELSDYDKNVLLNINRTITAVSLDLPAKEEDDSVTIGDFYAAAENVEESAIENLLNETMKKVMRDHLNERECWVIEHRHGMSTGIPMTLDECGKEIPDGPITRERVRQIEKRGLEKLKKVCEQMGLQEDYLELENTDRKSGDSNAGAE